MNFSNTSLILLMKIFFFVHLNPNWRWNLLNYSSLILKICSAVSNIGKEDFLAFLSLRKPSFLSADISKISSNYSGKKTQAEKVKIIIS